MSNTIHDAWDAIGAPDPFHTFVKGWHAAKRDGQADHIPGVTIMAQPPVSQPVVNQSLTTDERAALAGLVADIDGLVSESDGVAGLHLNGDVAPWGELLPGGRFERFEHLEAARAALAQQAGGQDRRDVLPDRDAVDLAREGMELHQPGQPEYIVCAELVRVAECRAAAKGDV